MSYRTKEFDSSLPYVTTYTYVWTKHNVLAERKWRQLIPNANMCKWLENGSYHFAGILHISKCVFVLNWSKYLVSLVKGKVWKTLA